MRILLRSSLWEVQSLFPADYLSRDNTEVRRPFTSCNFKECKDPRMRWRLQFQNQALYSCWEAASFLLQSASGCVNVCSVSRFGQGKSQLMTGILPALVTTRRVFLSFSSAT